VIFSFNIPFGQKCAELPRLDFGTTFEQEEGNRNKDCLAAQQQLINFPKPFSRAMEKYGTILYFKSNKESTTNFLKIAGFDLV
jgi:hypothetical protein